MEKNSKKKKKIKKKNEFLRFFEIFQDFSGFSDFFLPFFWFFGVFFMFFLVFFLDFWLEFFFWIIFFFLRFFWIFWFFLDFFSFFLLELFEFVLNLLRLPLKVTKVTTGQQKLPKIGQNSIRRSFLIERQKMPLVEGQRPPHELEVSSSYILLIAIMHSLVGSQKPEKCITNEASLSLDDRYLKWKNLQNSKNRSRGWKEYFYRAQFFKRHIYPVTGIEERMEVWSTAKNCK